MSAASLATSVPARPIATPISAPLRAGASLTPSPVMATMCPFSLRDSRILSLFAGETRAKTPIVEGRVRQFGLVEPVDVRTGQRPVPFRDAHVPGDGHGGRRVVARDHDRPNARLLGLGHRLHALLAGRVDHPPQSRQRQTLLNILRRHLLEARRRRQLAIGPRQHPQRLRGHLLIGLLDLPSPLLGQFDRLAVHQDVRAESQHADPGPP